jgi:type VI secretion system protein ImpK
MNRLTLSPEALGAMRQFQTFYRDLFDIKECIAAQRWNDLGGASPLDGAVMPAGAAARAVFARLYRAIAGQGFGVRGRDRGNGASVDVGYVMTAIADEALLHGPAWPGQETWPATLLEEALYGSRIAGERIFRTAHELAAGQLSRPALAISILLGLILGFRGRYYGIDDRGEIAALKEQLFGVIFHLPYPAQIDFQTLLSTGTAHPLNQASPRALPPLRPWAMAILVMLAAYLALSHLLWWQAVSPILSLAQQIIRDSAGLMR